MRRLANAKRLIIVATVFSSCASCTVLSTTLRLSGPLDVSKVSEIQAGVTDLRDILEWFGPPDFIVDGTQEIYDQKGGVMSGLHFPTRTLSAPEGTVIFLYSSNLRHEDLFMQMSIPVVTVDKYQYSVRANELMIFVRKRDYKVLNAFVGGDTNGHS